ncbi:unnamed protein product [Didymodactylos carnosus]|uniref:Fungal lipase-like domain-containing protein n=1 Tax=Didymodactylos carnosus TaxID=1234261 RepID=A0A815D3F8_9BILA|nr:unnamed protein product [Didymodactylos carnosus]CAF1291004.1 unnamed protein product [Didymodactylos carnosus]CAF3736676.1 unnamed protein product [Didymodactylos carnosus]CAF4096889.1 unnamed protein product [Didymodactylos carnosus]
MNIGLRHIKCLLITATAVLLTTATTTTTTIASDYESQTGLNYPQSLIDLACLASTFPSRFDKRHKGDEINNNNTCSVQILHNYTEITQIKDLVYDEQDKSFIANPYPTLGIKGLHLKVFDKKSGARKKHRELLLAAAFLGIDANDNQSVFIVIRHQEHDSLLTDEMNEMMSLFGPAATVDHQQGNREVFGTATVASFMRFIRQQLGLDWLVQAIQMFNKIQLHYTKQSKKVEFILSGFSSGGLYATALALYFNHPSITFASTGVEDILNDYYSHLFVNKREKSPPIYNFAHKLDPILQLDCQLGTVCVFSNEDSKMKKKTDKELEHLHLSTIFDINEPCILQWLRHSNKWICVTADRYNSKYGSCKRERQRWKERMKLTAKDEKAGRLDL